MSEMMGNCCCSPKGADERAELLLARGEREGKMLGCQAARAMIDPHTYAARPTEMKFYQYSTSAIISGCRSNQFIEHGGQ
jgi:hypothetical protein